ncbi:MAG: DUF1801 domain-containing protein [Calditrichia bacterium]
MNKRDEITFELQEFYFSQPKPLRSCFFALRDTILRFDDAITEEWKYRLPFFYLNGKSFCYLWKDKKTQQPYIGIHKGAQLEHPSLVAGDRTYIKVLPVDVDADIPETSIYEVLEMAREMHERSRKKGMKK